MFGRSGRRRSLVGTAARTAVVAGTATAVSGGVRARQDATRAAHASAPADTSGLGQAPAAMTNADVSAALLRLAELKTTGLLTEDEFAAAKARVLA